MKKVGSRGFSLIELLAVVVILGVLSGVGIGAYSRIVTKSKLEAYLDVVKLQAKEASKLVNAGDYYADDDNTVYYFDYKIFDDDKSMQSPFGKWINAYVAVVFDGDKYYYYWTGVDDAGWRIDLKKQVNKLTIKDIYHSSSKNIRPGNSIGGRDQTVIYEDGKDEKVDEVSNDVTSVEAKKCFKFKKINGGSEYSITDYDASCGSIVNIPSSIDGKIVSIIDENAFRNKGITDVSLYNGIKEIKNGAFQNNKITNLRLTKSIHTIGDFAFQSNQLKTVVFPEGLKYINQWAFSYNKLVDISFSKSLVSIGYYAFYGNLLSSIDLNSSPTVGGAAFSNNRMSSSEALIYKYDSRLGKTDYSTIIGYGGEDKNVVIPEEVNGVKVTTIAANAFASCGLTSIVIPDSVTSIGGAAFYSNSLTEIKLPKNLKYIGGDSFRGNRLRKIDIPKSVTTISPSAFVDNACPKGEDIIYARRDDGSIDYSTIVSGCSGSKSNRSLVIPASKNGVKLKLIKSYAFSCSGYTSITLPNLSETDGLTIETNAFSHNSIPLSSDSRWVYRIQNGKYNYSVLDSYAGVKPGGTLSIPEKSHDVNLTHIYATFQWQSYSTIVIPKYVTTIGNGVLGKSNNNNVNFTKVINKTGRSFDWYNITYSNHTNTGNFTTGVVSHQSGNITIADK